MSKIFISYRRADSQYVTDAIYLQLKSLFGEDNIFLDVGNIPFGVDFRQYLREQIETHDVVLVIIGPDWGKIMKERANQANDFVRIEVENALQFQKLVIPVLVMGAGMPDFSDLPASIADLQWRNSAHIRRHPDLEGDCKRLADGINSYFVNRTQINSPKKPTVKELLPEPFDWCYIPAGKVTLEGREGSYIPEGENQTFEVGAFYIAKYAVTNAQYALFVKAGGYQNENWWTKDGWKAKEEGWYWRGGWQPSGMAWLEPRDWQDTQRNGIEQPIVGVSWYEAIAFCLWLSEKTGEEIILPTEQQWQRAAQGDDGRKYPWGNDFDKNRAYTIETGIHNTTTLVTAFPNGVSPYSVFNMAGNVWEWCLTEYKTGNNDLIGTGDRLERGGAFNGIDEDVTTVRRHATLAYYRYYSTGFRICTSLSG